MNKANLIKWLKGTLIRAVKSVAQTALASIGTTSVVLSEFQWGFVLTTAGVAGVISILMSLERLPEDNPPESGKMNKDRREEDQADVGSEHAE